MRLLPLKIKINTLGDEARNIKAEEYGLTTAKRKNKVLLREYKRLFEAGIDDKKEVALAIRAKRAEFDVVTGFNGRTQDSDIIKAQAMRNAHRNYLRDHRLDEVRPECRAANIAYAFLRGVPFHVVEDRGLSHPNWTRVGEIIKKFGPNRVGVNTSIAQDIYTWFEASEHGTDSVDVGDEDFVGCDFVTEDTKEELAEFLQLNQ